jgi:twitching motility protein PilU
MEFAQLLELMIDGKASDLFLSVGAPAQIKVEGNMVHVGDGDLNSEDIHHLVYSILTKAQISEFESTSELNMALRAEGIGRFRINVFRQKGEIALVARHIVAMIPSIEELGLPGILKNLILEPRGLLLMVGGTGTGKSTTLASMLDFRNQRQTGHILSIEDPVEFVHEHKMSLVNQREIGIDTESYATALKNAMREAPDVIMIGEIRDKETMKSAIVYAETGHLCVSTLHANNANQAIDRVINFFPQNEHKQLLQDLSLNLRAIVSQRLPRGVSGKRVAAVEVMLNTPYVSDLIQKAEISKIKDAMQKSRTLGSQTFDDALYELVEQGKLSAEEALQHADSRNDLSLRFRLEGTGARSRIKVDVAYAKSVNYSDFQIYRIRQISVDEKYEDRVHLFENAFRNTMNKKGFRESREDAEMEVQYVFASKPSVSKKMKEITNPVSSGIDLVLDTKLHGLLKISIVDLSRKKAIWQIVATMELAIKPRPQKVVNKDADYLLSEFPPILD